MSSGSATPSGPPGADAYFEGLGKLFANLQSLEFCLRAFLLARQPARGSVDYQKTKKGVLVPENAFTNWDSLGQLVRKYNQTIRSRHASLCIDRSVVDLRDALAHGRVWGSSQSGPWYLLRFDRPKKGQVRISFVTEVSALWFRDQANLTIAQVLKIMAAAKLLGMNVFEQ